MKNILLLILICFAQIITAQDSSQIKNDMISFANMLNNNDYNDIFNYLPNKSNYDNYKNESNRWEEFYKPYIDKNSQEVFEKITESIKTIKNQQIKIEPIATEYCCHNSKDEHAFKIASYFKLNDKIISLEFYIEIVNNKIIYVPTSSFYIENQTKEDVIKSLNSSAYSGHVIIDYEDTFPTVSNKNEIIGKWKLSDQNFIVDYSETNFSAKNLENGNVQKGTYILENDILIENQNGVEKVYRVNLTSNSLKIHPISNKEKIFTFNRVKETKNILHKTPWAQTTTKPLFNNNLSLNEFIELLKSKIIFEIDQNQNLKNKLKGKQRIFVNVTVTSDKRFVDIMTRSVSQELKNIVEDLIKQQQIYSEGKKDGVSVNTLISFPISLNFN